MRKPNTKALAKLIQLCTEWADLINDQGLNNTYSYNDFRLGYRALSRYINEGIIAVIDLQEQYYECMLRKQLAKNSENDARQILEDIFGDGDLEERCDKDIERIKEFVYEIDREHDLEDEEYETEDYGVALLEKPHDEGLSKDDVLFLFNKLSGVNAIPVEIQGENSTAMGFINLTDAEFMDYDYTELEKSVKEILNDMSRENESSSYECANKHGITTIWLGRQ